jgi:hypothetical protein
MRPSSIRSKRWRMHAGVSKIKEEGGGC